MRTSVSTRDLKADVTIKKLTIARRQEEHTGARQIQTKITMKKSRF
jgi:hypothetical protein